MTSAFAVVVARTLLLPVVLLLLEKLFDRVALVGVVARGLVDGAELLSSRSW